MEQILKSADLFKILDLYFGKDFSFVRHHTDSYDHFIHGVSELLTTKKHTFSTVATETEKISHFLKFENIQFVSPVNNNGDFITPSEARINNLSYDLTIIADITQYQEIEKLNVQSPPFRRMVGSKVFNFILTKIPLMVKSKYCNLTINRNLHQSECDYDNGGYFIVNGTERVLVPFEQLIDNKTLIFQKKESGIDTTIAQLNSKSTNPDEMRQIINIRMKNSENIILRAPIIRDINVFIMLRALGIESDKDIIDLIVPNENDWEMRNLLKTVLDKCRTDDGKMKIYTQKNALEYLIKKVKVDANFTETDAEEKRKQKIIHLQKLLKNNFIPHIEKNHKAKAHYICHMVQKILLAFLGRKKYDERDNYENKRIEMPGTILTEMFRKGYKLFLGDCKKNISKSIGKDTPLNVIDSIKTTVIESGIKRNMTKDEYSGRTGVCQIVQRGSYLNFISLLTRIDAQIKNKKSSSKLLQTRYGHATQLFLICFAQTPENAKSGLVKHMAMTTRLTLQTKEQTKILKDTMLKGLTKLEKVKISEMKSKVKVLLNGVILGVVDPINAKNYCENLRQKKLRGEIDIFTSITHNIKSEYEMNEINVWCDSGRLVAPMMRVVDNVLQVKKNHIIAMEKIIRENKNETFETFMKSNPGLFEYVGPDELTNSIVAASPQQVKYQRTKQLKSIELMKKKKENIFVRELNNRYNEYSFHRYSYCVIHPSTSMGIVANAVPFPQNMQSPRFIYSYSQIKQAMCIYSTIYRNRHDNSYVLYNPQRSLVTTRMMKYSHTDTLTFGENSIVAIMTYTGFNQDDSLIFNKSAIDVGFMRSTSLAKYQSKQEKDQMTGQNDKFCKPDRNTTIQMKPGSYEKLNDAGFAPNETIIEDGDAIIGKTTPIQDSKIGQNNKTAKDASVPYKSGEKGTVERVWPNIVNAEGYRMIKILTRSDRRPTVGDKFSSRHGNKGTIGAVYRQVDLPFTEDGVYPDIILTPNAFPSRMAVSQIHEALCSKYASIEGKFVDGTAFEPSFIEEIKSGLKKSGFDKEGNETLTNGMTGMKLEKKIFICPTYYCRLKHLVNDKIHARSRGPVTSLTRQPLEGRARDGGLRFGEMERDCMIAHGTASFLLEKMRLIADNFIIHYCQTCGLVAHRKKTSSNVSGNRENDIYVCGKCKNRAKIYKTAIPYAYHVLNNELLALGIEPRMSFE